MVKGFKAFLKKEAEATAHMDRWHAEFNLPGADELYSTKMPASHLMEKLKKFHHESWTILNKHIHKRNYSIGFVSVHDQVVVSLDTQPDQKGIYRALLLIIEPNGKYAVEEDTVNKYGEIYIETTIENGTLKW